MHTGRYYPLDLRLRLYSCGIPYPYWWPLKYVYPASSWQLSSMGGSVLVPSFEMEVVGWSPGDYDIHWIGSVVFGGHTYEVSLDYLLTNALPGFGFDLACTAKYDGVTHVSATAFLPNLLIWCKQVTFNWLGAGGPAIYPTPANNQTADAKDY